MFNDLLCKLSFLFGVGQMSNILSQTRCLKIKQFWFLRSTVCFFIFLSSNWYVLGQTLSVLLSVFYMFMNKLLSIRRLRIGEPLTARFKSFEFFSEDAEGFFFCCIVQFGGHRQLMLCTCIRHFGFFLYILTHLRSFDRSNLWFL